MYQIFDISQDYFLELKWFSLINIFLTKVIVNKLLFIISKNEKLL